jgi:hypothetical protein
LYGDERNWPASWVQFERRKFLLQEGRVIAKFEGLGHFGRETLDRASLLAEKKFGPPVGSLGDGYAGYKRLRGRPANASELNAALLDRIAEYLAFRVGAFPVDRCAADVAKMASCNLEEEFGGNVCAPRPAINSPIIADGRMLPHEWIQTARGWIKTDGANHGDDHFFPGPTDIAWDLAGAIIEWELSQDAIQYLLRRYEWLTGDAAGKRLPAWTAAYAIFRMAYCKMAAQALEGTPEQARLHMEYRRYRSRVLECCRALAA